jgi:hypothetical protein
MCISFVSLPQSQPIKSASFSLAHIHHNDGLRIERELKMKGGGASAE